MQLVDWAKKFRKDLTIVPTVEKQNMLQSKTNNPVRFDLEGTQVRLILQY